MKRTRNGMSETRTYRSWIGMIYRCSNKKSDAYCYYGDKGITYDPRWNNFQDFLNDMGERPSGTELDRIDGAKGYYKENCRWISHAHNNSNKKYKRKTPYPRGVYRERNSFSCCISVNGERKYLGHFRTVEKAEQVFLKEYKKIYGELPPEYRHTDLLTELDTIEKE